MNGLNSFLDWYICRLLFEKIVAPKIEITVDMSCQPYMGALTQALCVDCGFSITVCGAGTGRTAAYLQSVMLHVSDLVQPYCILRAVYRVCLWVVQCGVMTSPRREKRGESVTFYHKTALS